ncbi:MAG: hypothetical protein R2911_32560 [Caldilineaceae bacterium]
MADVFGKIEQGPVIGDNLATSIYAKSGNGVVHDAAIRDLDGVQEIAGFTSFFRGFIRPMPFHHYVGGGQLSGAHRQGDGYARRCGAGAAGWRGLYSTPSGGESGQNIGADSACATALASSGWPKASTRRARSTGAGRITLSGLSGWLEDHMDELPVPKAAIQELLKERTW